MRRFKLVLFLGCITLLLMTVSTFARDKSSGCGLGWDVYGDESFLGTSVRGTTHSVLNPTFSMTFGTSGCSRHSIVKNEAKGMHYAESNFASLMIEMSQGNGEFLTGFSEVLGCTKADDTFRQVMQTKYGEIYSSTETTPMEMYQEVLKQIQQDSVLSNNCYSI